MIKCYTFNGESPRPPDETMRILTRAEAIAEINSSVGKRCGMVMDIAHPEVLYSHRFDMIFGLGGKITLERLKSLMPNKFTRFIWEEFMQAIRALASEASSEYLSGATLELSFLSTIRFPDFWGSEQITVLHQVGELFLLRQEGGKTQNSLAMIIYFEIGGGHPFETYYHISPMIKKDGILHGATKRLIELSTAQIKRRLPFTVRQRSILSELPNRKNAKSIRMKLKMAKDTYDEHLENIRRLTREELGLEINPSDLARIFRALHLC